jgi:hypothetical protein
VIESFHLGGCGSAPFDHFEAMSSTTDQFVGADVLQGQVGLTTLQDKVRLDCVEDGDTAATVDTPLVRISLVRAVVAPYAVTAPKAFGDPSYKAEVAVGDHNSERPIFPLMAVLDSRRMVNQHDASFPVDDAGEVGSLKFGEIWGGIR